MSSPNMDLIKAQRTARDEGYVLIKQKPNVIYLQSTEKIVMPRYFRKRAVPFVPGYYKSFCRHRSAAKIERKQTLKLMAELFCLWRYGGAEKTYRIYTLDE